MRRSLNHKRNSGGVRHENMLGRINIRAISNLNNYILYISKDETWRRAIDPEIPTYRVMVMVR